MPPVEHLAAGAEILTESSQHAGLLDRLHDGHLVRGHVGFLTPLGEDPAASRGTGDQQEVQTPVDERVGDNAQLAHPRGFGGAVDRHLGGLILLASGHFLTQKIGLFEGSGCFGVREENLSEAQRGMLPGKLVYFHPEPTDFHHVTNPADTLPLGEGPELVELPLGDSDLLSRHRAPRPVPCREIVAAPLAPDTELLTAFPHDITLLDLDSTGPGQLGGGGNNEEFAADWGRAFRHGSDLWGLTTRTADP